jgi:hypothetical protein
MLENIPFQKLDLFRPQTWEAATLLVPSEITNLSHWTQFPKGCILQNSGLWTSLRNPSDPPSVIHHHQKPFTIYRYAIFRNVLYSKRKTKFRGLSPLANYSDRATAVCQRSYCELLWVGGVAWSAQRISTAVLFHVYLVFIRCWEIHAHIGTFLSVRLPTQGVTEPGSYSRLTLPETWRCFRPGDGSSRPICSCRLSVPCCP